MFKFCSLYSGSTGNSLFVETDNTKVLVDTGESCKKIVEGRIISYELFVILLTYKCKNGNIYHII